MERLENALKIIDRANFLPEDVRGRAGFDVALPIGFGQTCSQPLTIKFMIEWLRPDQGDKVLDIGSGSGWSSALLAYIVAPSGEVYAVEKIPELVEFGRENCRRFGIYNAHFFKATRRLGLESFAPFDRILVSASSDHLPSELIKQLRVGGKMVVPVGDDILEVEKTAPDKTDITVHSGFVFVPLVR